MSKYRVQIDVSFESEQDAIDLMNYIENIKSKAYKPKGVEKIECFRSCRYHDCTHDNETPIPCKDYISVDFEKEKKEHKPKGG